MKTAAARSLLPPRPRASARAGWWLRARRITVTVAVVLAVLYGLIVVSGYAWLHFVVKNDRVGFLDVALLRWHRVRRATAVEQFAEAQRDWGKGDYQAAYLAFISGVRNDPDNIDGRLAAARFLAAAGAVNQEVTLLEEGLARAPDDARLIDATFTLLTSIGRDRHALELLHQRYAGKLTGPNGALLRTAEVLATLDADGAAAAGALLDKYPDLRTNADSAPTVSRVLWENHSRSEAIDLLGAYVRAHPTTFTARAQLAQWQVAGGLVDDAVQTVRAACAESPKDPAPRVLLIDVLASADALDSPPWRQAVEAYLKDFGDQPVGIALLANLAGQRGWTGLAQALYLVGANRQPDVGGLALYYSDALFHARRPADARQILADIETQIGGGNTTFFRQLRQRQVEVAAAMGDADGVRNYARRLAALMADDPDARAAVRQRFAREGIAEAAAELAGASPAGTTARRE